MKKIALLLAVVLFLLSLVGCGDTPDITATVITDADSADTAETEATNIICESDYLFKTVCSVSEYNALFDEYVTSPLPLKYEDISYLGDFKMAKLRYGLYEEEGGYVKDPTIREEAFFNGECYVYLDFDYALGLAIGNSVSSTREEFDEHAITDTSYLPEGELHLLDTKLNSKINWSTAYSIKENDKEYTYYVYYFYSHVDPMRYANLEIIEWYAYDAENDVTFKYVIWFQTLYNDYDWLSDEAINEFLSLETLPKAIHKFTQSHLAGIAAREAAEG